MEREAPNNAFVIIAFGVLGAGLQVAAVVMARRLAGAAAPAADDDDAADLKRREAAASPPDDDSDSADTAGDRPPGWRKKANLRMYTILDKIF